MNQKTNEKTISRTRDQNYNLFKKVWESAQKILHENPKAYNISPHNLESLLKFLKAISVLLEVSAQYKDDPNDPFFDFFLTHDILHTLFAWALDSGQNFELLKIAQLKIYQILLVTYHQKILIHKPILRPLLKLIKACNKYGINKEENGYISLSAAKKLVFILNEISGIFHRERGLWDFYVAISSESYKYLFVSTLVNLIQGENEIGQLARNALLFYTCQSQVNEDLARYLEFESNFSAVSTTSLACLFANLPRDLGWGPDHPHRISKEALLDIPGLLDLLNFLQFLDVVLQRINPSIGSQLTTMLFDGFLSPVVYQHLLQDVQNALGEVITSTAYLEIMIRHIRHPDMVKTFLQMLMTGSPCLLDIMIGRLDTNLGGEQLAMANLQCLHTLVDLNCEDIMMYLCFRYLIPCNHLQTPFITTDIDMLRNDGSDAKSFLSLSNKLLHGVTACTEENVDINYKSESTEKPTSDNSSNASHNLIAYGIDSHKIVFSCLKACTFRTCEPRKHLRKLKITFNNNKNNNNSSNLNNQSTSFDESISSQSSVHLAPIHHHNQNKTQGRAKWLYPYTVQNPGFKYQYKSTQYSTHINHVNVHKEKPNNDISSDGDSQTTTNTFESNQDMTNLDGFNIENLTSFINQNTSLISHPNVENTNAIIPGNILSAIDTEYTEYLQHNRKSNQNHMNKNNDTLNKGPHVEESIQINDVPNHELPNLGPFLTTILTLVDRIPWNSLYFNLALTRLVSRLCAFPCPLLQSILLNTQASVKPEVFTLYKILERVVKRLLEFQLTQDFYRSSAHIAGSYPAMKSEKSDSNPNIKHPTKAYTNFETGDSETTENAQNFLSSPCAQSLQQLVCKAETFLDAKERIYAKRLAYSRYGPTGLRAPKQCKDAKTKHQTNENAHYSEISNHLKYNYPMYNNNNEKSTFFIDDTSDEDYLRAQTIYNSHGDNNRALSFMSSEFNPCDIYQSHDYAQVFGNVKNIHDMNESKNTNLIEHKSMVTSEQDGIHEKESSLSKMSGLLFRFGKKAVPPPSPISKDMNYKNLQDLTALTQANDQNLTLSNTHTPFSMPQSSVSQTKIEIEEKNTHAFLSFPAKNAAYATIVLSQWCKELSTLASEMSIALLIILQSTATANIIPFPLNNRLERVSLKDDGKSLFVK